MHKNLETTFQIRRLYRVIYEVGKVWKNLSSSSKLPIVSVRREGGRIFQQSNQLC